MILEIRRKVAENQFEFSKHAVDQSILRQIRVEEIKEAVANGQVIEYYPDDKYGASCLIFGWTQTQRPIHIQCSYPSRPLIKIITLYQPNPKRWNNDFTQRRVAPMTNEWQEKLVEKQVTYTLNLNGKMIIVENVPARVNEETGEQFFSPSTVEHLQETILASQEPNHYIKVPVYDFMSA